ncbi:MAG: hypothetical protein MRZ21_01080 [Coriobacteriaceae bacterium]|nr:hypothetical protein [Coriobacteriaceae bacterium]
MRQNISWGNIEATTDGGFERLPAGPYVARIQTFADNAQKQYVEATFDIAEGDKAGFYSDEWAATHPFAHHFFLSYKDSALGMLKGRLQAIQDSNPGFDAFAAWDAGRLDMFMGRLLGINLQEEEYESNGEVKTCLNVCQVIPAQDVRDGKVKARDVKRLDNSGTSYAAPAKSAATYVSDEDAPF